MLTVTLDFLSHIRAPVVTLACGVYTLVQSAVAILAASVTSNLRVLDTVCVTLWARPLLWVNGVSLEIRGAERINLGGKGFLILFNHSSHMDIPVLFCFPRSFRFGAKIELFKIPFFGRAMRMLGVLPIDRGNRNKVMQVYQSAIDRVENGECFALAPEGTRQPEPRIGPFKRGPFEFAVNARMDIVPVVIAGAYEVMPRHSIWINKGRWRRKVIMEILPPVSASAEGAEEKLESLMAKVRMDMERVFLRNHAELAQL